MLPHFAELRLDRVEPSHVGITDLQAVGYAAATIRKAYQLTSAAFRAAVDAGYLPRSPCRGIELPRDHKLDEMRFLAPEEVKELADSVAPRHRAFVLAAAYTGLRFGELAALRTERLNLLRRNPRVEEAVSEVRGELIFGPPKSKASRRTIALPTFLVDELDHHLSTYGPSPEGLVFTGDRAGPLRRSNFRHRIWLPAVSASVGQPCRFHDLRHSHAAMLIREEVHPKVIQERLGHASIRTTLDTYGHLFEGLDEAAAAAMDASWRDLSSLGTRATDLAPGRVRHMTTG